MSDTYLSLYNLELNEAPFSAKFIKLAPESLPPECLLPETPSLSELPALDTSLPPLACKFDILEPIIPPAYFCTPSFSGSIVVHGDDGDTTIAIERTPDTECDYQFNGEITIPCVPEIGISVSSASASVTINELTSSQTLSFSSTVSGTSCSPTIEITPTLSDLSFTIPTCTTLNIDELEEPIEGDVAGTNITEGGKIYLSLGATAEAQQNDDGTCEVTLSFAPAINAEFDVEACSTVTIDTSGGSNDGEISGSLVTTGNINFNLDPSASSTDCGASISFSPTISADLSICDDSVISKIYGSAVTGSIDITVAGQTIGTLDLGGEVSIENGEGACANPIITVVLSPTWNAATGITTKEVDICEDGEISTVTILVIE